ncbi:MAG: type II toxin-antitoxin system Phd/YefM family antitoxin [Nitrospinae bacterium]|nr:type II toxin-antitoxin system Phd/YefM family antitoxin [Nitrospinota bacterium]
MIELHPEVLTKNGRKEFVVLPYEEFVALQQLLEDMEDLRDLRTAKTEDTGKPDISLEDAKKELLK